jgi:hypothetical protein
VRRTISLVAALAALSLTPSAALAVKYQGWETDLTHVHLETPTAMFQSYATRTVVPVTILLHNSHARVERVRWSCESDVKQAVPLAFIGTGASEETRRVNLTIDPALCPRGWQEIRWTVDTTLPDGSREFTTGRECVNIVTGNGTTQDYCGGPTVAGRCGGGAWYAATTYLIGFVDCRDWYRAITTGFRAGDRIRVRTQSGGGGIATFDPDFHHGNPGIGAQATPPWNRWATAKIPNLAVGQHTLHLRDRLLGFSGAVVMPLKIVA